MAERLLIVADDESLCESLRGLFVREGYDVTVMRSAEDTLAQIDDLVPDVVITDMYLPGLDGIELIRKAKERYSDILFVLVTAHPSLETAVAAVRAGAFDYVVKPIIHAEIKRIVRRACERRSSARILPPVVSDLSRRYDFGRIIGESEALQKVIRAVQKIADARSSVLLLGETGTGKELIARTIHYNSRRSERAFVAINCSAIPENLLESELFGHVKGAFTSAVSAKRGLLEEASGGTVLLDEIGDLSTMLQVKLLRVLEDREIRPIGGVKNIHVDLRVITATNRDINRAVKEGRFREDLYYRINTVSITLPPLRDRRDDIEPLLRYFIDHYSHELGRQTPSLSEDALEVLRQYRWPGNVRELQNVIERAILVCENGVINFCDLPESMRGITEVCEESVAGKLSIEDYSKAFIQKYQAQYTEHELAEMLGITRKALWEKRKRWGIGRHAELQK